MNSPDQELAESAGGASPEERQSPAQPLVEQAREAMNRGDVSATREALDQALAADPDHATALQLSGVLNCRMRQYTDGIAAFRRLTEVKPEKASSWFNLGKALNDARQFVESMDPLARALEIQPEHTAARVLLGLAQRETGDTEAAIESLRHAREQAPEDPAATSAMAAILGSEGKHDEAVNLFLEAVQHQPNLPDTHYNLGKGLLARAAAAYAGGQDNERVGRDLAAGAESFRQALLIDSHFHDARLGLGEIAEARQDWFEAISHYRKVHQKRPRDLQATILLMRLLIAGGRVSEAAEHLAQITETAPEVLRTFWSAQIDRRRGKDVRARLEALLERPDAQFLQKDIQNELMSDNQAPAQ
ncbi:MAG: tetratricopeptide repeat protein [Xanthomonadales bacterium]|nr:tetratricopeptide repeat protein [Xanthomonadales bacterium]